MYSVHKVNTLHFLVSILDVQHFPLFHDDWTGKKHKHLIHLTNVKTFTNLIFFYKLESSGANMLQLLQPSNSGRSRPKPRTTQPTTITASEQLCGHGTDTLNTNHTDEMCAETWRGQWLTHIHRVYNPYIIYKYVYLYRRETTRSFRCTRIIVIIYNFLYIFS